MDKDDNSAGSWPGDAQPSLRSLVNVHRFPAKRDLRQDFPLKEGFRVRDKDTIEDPKSS